MFVLHLTFNWIPRRWCRNSDIYGWSGPYGSNIVVRGEKFGQIISIGGNWTVGSRDTLSTGSWGGDLYLHQMHSFADISIKSQLVKQLCPIDKIQLSFYEAEYEKKNVLTDKTISRAWKPTWKCCVSHDSPSPKGVQAWEPPFSNICLTWARKRKKHFDVKRLHLWGTTDITYHLKSTQKIRKKSKIFHQEIRKNYWEIQKKFTKKLKNYWGIQKKSSRNPNFRDKQKHHSEIHIFPQKKRIFLRT